MESEYRIKGLPFVLVAFALSLCTFMEVLDFTVANVSVPYISGDLGVSNNEGTWVLTLYMVGNAIVMPISGWLSEKIGAVRLILISSALFGVTSFICGISATFPMLCVSRFAQGAVAGPLIPLSQTLLVEIFPKDKKQMAFALWAMVALVGPIAGPIVGGWITQDFNWRWIFFINIPVSIFTVMIFIIYMRQYIGKVTQKRLDYVGLILLVVGITCLQILLDKGRQLDWFKSPTIRLLGGISLVCLSILVVYEWNHKDPLIEMKLLKIRSYTIGTLIYGLSFMVFFSPIVITPLWLENYMGYSPLKAGITLATMGILPFLLAPLVGKLMGTGRLKLLVALSFFLMSLSHFYFTTFDTSINFTKLALSRFYLGIGLTFFIAPITSLCLVHVPLDKIPRASGILQFFRIFMSGVGTSLYTTIWDDRATVHHSNLTSTLTKFNPNLTGIKEVVLRNIHAAKEGYLAYLNRLVDEQAYMLATNDVMLISGVVLMLLLILLYFVNVSVKEVKEVGLRSGH